MIQDCCAVYPHCCFARLSELGCVTLLAINEKLLVAPVGRKCRICGANRTNQALCVKRRADQMIIASSTVSQRLALTQLLGKLTPQETDEVLYSISSPVHMCTRNQRPTKFAAQ